MVNSRRGYTLMELLVVSAILALLFSLGSTLLIKVTTFFRISVGKVETQRDVRNSMNLLTRELRQAKSSTVTLGRADTSQPPYSKISFQKLQGDSLEFWQQGRGFYMKKNGLSSELNKNVRVLIFSYPSTENPNLVTILLSVEKDNPAGQTQSILMGGETLRLLNE